MAPLIKKRKDAHSLVLVVLNCFLDRIRNVEGIADHLDTDIVLLLFLPFFLRSLPKRDSVLAGVEATDLIVVIAPDGAAERVKYVLALGTLRETNFHDDFALCLARLRSRSDFNEFADLFLDFFDWFLAVSILFGLVLIVQESSAGYLVVVLLFAVNLVLLMHLLKMILDFNLVQNVRVGGAVRAHMHKLVKAL